MDRLQQIEYVASELRHFRAIRDQYQHSTEMRSMYNAVCNRLDVLLSKLYEEEKRQVEEGAG